MDLFPRSSFEDSLDSVDASPSTSADCWDAQPAKPVVWDTDQAEHFSVPQWVGPAVPDKAAVPGQEPAPCDSHQVESLPEPTLKNNKWEEGAEKGEETGGFTAS